MDSIARTVSGGSCRLRLAKSCFICSGLEVPVSGRMPTARAKLKTICAGVTFARAARSLNHRMMQHLRIRSEKRETLIDNLSLRAEKPHLAIPTQTRETAVLHKCGGFGMRGSHLLKMLQRNIAHPEETRAACIALLHHRRPNLAVSFRPTVSGSGTVQNIAVDVVGPKMLERTGHRLRDLIGKVGRRIVRQPVILTRAGR